MSGRLGDWETRLAAYLARVAAAPCGLENHVCCLFGAGAVLAVTGVDPLAAVRGRYSTEAGAARVLRRTFGPSIEAALDDRFERVAPGFARRGDLAMHDGSVGVVIGREALFVGEEGGKAGLVRIARAQWTGAWRV